MDKCWIVEHGVLISYIIVVLVFVFQRFWSAVKRDCSYLHWGLRQGIFERIARDNLGFSIRDLIYVDVSVKTKTTSLEEI